MSITLKDIAKKLGVSTTAVSKALNNHEDISDELKKKVREVAEELNYSPNAIARRLVSNRSRTLGVFVLSRQDEENVDYLGYTFLLGIINEANKFDFDIVLFTTDSDFLQERSYIDLCEERKVEGAIFLGLHLDDPHLEELKNSKIPIAVIDTDLKGKNNLFVTSDNEKGIKKALSYLYRLGHREIALISGHKGAEITQRRLSAYEEFLKSKNIYNPELVFSADFTEESGYEAGNKIANLTQQPTAVLAMSDIMAIGAMEAIKKYGFKIPGDISFVGYDNIKIAQYTTPSLTSINQDGYSMGKAAAQLTLKSLDIDLNLINNISKISSREIVIDTELIVRNSCKEIE